MDQILNTDKEGTSRRLKMGFFERSVEDMEAKRDVWGLIDRLLGKKALDHERATLALVKIGEPSVKSLLVWLKDDDWMARFRVAIALGKIGEPSVEPLIQALKDDRSIGWGAAIALGKIGDARAVEPLIQTLKDKDQFIREQVARALGEIRDVKAVKPLIEALEDESSLVRLGAAEALGKIGDKAALPALIFALMDSSPYVCEASAKALAKIGTDEKKTRDAVTEPLTERDFVKILSNVKSLVFEQMGFKEAIKILEKAAERYPNSAPVQFSLGVTYSRIAGEYKDEDAVRPWALKSGEAFKKAINLANRYGGLNDEQLAKARESVELVERAKHIKERKTPSIPEDQRKKIYADFMETQDSEFLSGSLQGIGGLSVSLNFNEMAKGLYKGADAAKDAAAVKITKKYGITKGQLSAIEDEGKTKNWPFKSVTRR